ncbi:hypothetical protein A2U01_0109741, partial [Trifolium medium]|nr:hypothetical protein [Trifolium medium]
MQGSSRNAAERDTVSLGDLGAADIGRRFLCIRIMFCDRISLQIGGGKTLLIVDGSV